MPASRTVFIIINAVLGPLVLVSYVASARVWPAQVGALWGGVPEGWRLPYTVNMFLAAAGYLAFTWHLFRHADAEGVRFFGRFGLGLINLAYLLILLPSAIWMPLTAYAVAHGRDLMGAIRIVLWLVALGSLVVAMALASQRPERPRGTLSWARLGALPFCLQTVILDAVVWPSLFTIPS